ncbi:MAG TPA: hypothetical protein VGM90_13450 [Kofleriaceae bacterium]
MGNVAIRSVERRPVATPARPRIVWLALSEARGHLMRAQLAARLLAPEGIDVDIVTTGAEGVAFMAEFGLRATLISEAFSLAYDDRQNLARVKSRAIAMRYLFSPKGCLREMAWFDGYAANAAMIVNDSYHPALLMSCFANTQLSQRIVHVHGENMRRSVESTAGRGVLRSMMQTAFARSTRIEIAPDATDIGSSFAGGEIYRLPPLMPAPRPASVVRAELGVTSNDTLAVVYLNPYFRDPAIAQAIDDATRAGYMVYAVGEGFLGRPGWRGADPALADVVAAADVFISAAGMGAVSLAKAAGVPLIAIATDQPEQRANLAAADGMWTRIVELGPNTRQQLVAALAAVPSIPRSNNAELAVRRSRAQWSSTLRMLVDRNLSRKA